MRGQSATVESPAKYTVTFGFLSVRFIALSLSRRFLMNLPVAARRNADLLLENPVEIAVSVADLFRNVMDFFIRLKKQTLSLFRF